MDFGKPFRNTISQWDTQLCLHSLPSCQHFDPLTAKTKVLNPLNKYVVEVVLA